MTKPTIRDCLVAALKAKGAEQIKSRSRKYLAFILKAHQRHYFIGPAGGLRWHTRNAPSASYSLEGTTTRQELIAEGRRICGGGG